MSDHVRFACCYEGCGHFICFTPEQEKRLRRTHESWQCPAGHGQHFSAETEDEKTIRVLREKLEHRDWLLACRQETIDDLKSEVRSLRSKLAWRERWLRLRGALS